MKEYHKIQTVFKRNQDTRNHHVIESDYSLPVFDFLKHNTWIFTEKVDGTNIRVMVKDSVSFGGKTDNAQIPSLLVDRLRTLFDPLGERLREMFPDGACFYGEGYGAKIQKGGGNYIPHQDFVLFDIKIGEWWLERPNVEDIALQLGLDCVPIIGKGTLLDMVEMARNGIESKWGPFAAEGIVARPMVELKTRNGERVITKIKTRDFEKVKSQ